MIHIELPNHRARVARSLDHWHREMEIYRTLRRESIVNYVGTTNIASSLGVDPQQQKRMIGNLIQLSAQARAITLAYNDARFLVVANSPAGEVMQERLEEFYNRYLAMIGLGDVARGIALDSYFGFGIAKVDTGWLPPGVQRSLGQSVGPMCWRVSQDNFVYDGSATSWDQVAYVGDMRLVPLEAARNFEPFLEFNPDAAQGLQEYSRNADKTDGRIHNSHTSGESAMPMTRLVDVHFPLSGTVATWPANDTTFSQVSGEPLLLKQWTGHHTGPYAVLSDMDIPDNLIPVPQSESTKRLHFLFNELADITSEQARKAKINQIYQAGSQRDVQRWENAADRDTIPVSDIKQLGALEKPGPTQSQTAYMLSSLQMFKEFGGNLDDTLGLGATAATARQSELIRASTTVRGGEQRRRMNRVMELIARKLGHLALNDQTLKIPMRRSIPRSSLSLDVSWLPPSQLPRGGGIDDYLVSIVQTSMEFRSAKDRLDQLNEATGQIIQIAQAAAAGVPLELDKIVETQAKYRDLPELREWCLGLLPDHQQEKQSARLSASSAGKPNGQYTRENVSRATNEGSLTQALTQFSDAPADVGGAYPTRAAG